MAYARLVELGKEDLAYATPLARYAALQYRAGRARANAGDLDVGRARARGSPLQLGLNAPNCEILAGGDLDSRRSRYLANIENVADLYLTTYQTLQRDSEHVQFLFREQGVRFYLVVDEAHYIKQIGGAWADAVMNVSRHASRRCVLTGTPFPKSYLDAFNLFDVLWPNGSPISTDDRHLIDLHSRRNEHAQAAAILDATIGPFYYRVRKSDLNLAPQHFHEPVVVRMNERERLVYDSIIERIRYESQSDFFRDFELLVRLRRGRMMRLRQCVSYTALLSTAIEEYSEDIINHDGALSEIIQQYDDVEIPAKLEAMLLLVQELRSKGEKIVIWSNFVRTLELISRTLTKSGYGVRLIYGATPFETAAVDQELTREHIIREFLKPEGEGFQKRPCG